MSTRRDFLAFLGNACFVGSVIRKEGLTRPTLALPYWTMPVLTKEPPVACPTRHPLLTAAGSQANAVMQIRAGLPDGMFLDFIEGGLRNARMFKGRDQATMDRVIEAAVEKHGSISAAMRAGVLS
jgi:hypothetical protein